MTVCSQACSSSFGVVAGDGDEAGEADFAVSGGELLFAAAGGVLGLLLAGGVDLPEPLALAAVGLLAGDVGLGLAQRPLRVERLEPDRDRAHDAQTASSSGARNAGPTSARGQPAISNVA